MGASCVCMGRREGGAPSPAVDSLVAFGDGERVLGATGDGRYALARQHRHIGGAQAILRVAQSWSSHQWASDHWRETHDDDWRTGGRQHTSHCSSASVRNASPLAEALFCHCRRHSYQSELQTPSVGRKFPADASASEMHGIHLLGCEAGMSHGMHACEPRWLRVSSMHAQLAARRCLFLATTCLQEVGGEVIT